MSVAKDAARQLEQIKSQGISIDEALVNVHKRTRDPKFPDKRAQEDEKRSDKKKAKKAKKKSKTIEELRAERIAREAAEHERAKLLLQPAAARPPTGRARSPSRFNGAFFK